MSRSELYGKILFDEYFWVFQFEHKLPNVRPWTLYRHQTTWTLLFIIWKFLLIVTMDGIELKFIVEKYLLGWFFKLYASLKHKLWRRFRELFELSYIQLHPVIFITIVKNDFNSKFKKKVLIILTIFILYEEASIKKPFAHLKCSPKLKTFNPFQTPTLFLPLWKNYAEVK